MLNSKFCHWYEDPDGVWHTDCHHAFELNTDGPIANAMKFCCYCGKNLIEVKYKGDHHGKAEVQH